MIAAIVFLIMIGLMYSTSDRHLHSPRHGRSIAWTRMYDMVFVQRMFTGMDTFTLMECHSSSSATFMASVASTKDLMRDVQVLVAFKGGLAISHRGTCSSPNHRSAASDTSRSSDPGSAREDRGRQGLLGCRHATSSTIGVMIPPRSLASTVPLAPRSEALPRRNRTGYPDRNRADDRLRHHLSSQGLSE